MRFIIDTNIIFSALIKDSDTRKLLINPPFMLYSPESMIDEIIKYEELIIEKSGLAKEDFNLLFELLIENINVIDKEEYKNNLEKADIVIGNVHKGDVPFLALALSIHNDGIWSEDKHFEKQNIIKVWKTEEIISLIEENS